MVDLQLNVSYRVTQKKVTSGKSVFLGLLIFFQWTGKFVNDYIISLFLIIRYDGYLREAHRMYKEMKEVCKNFQWPADDLTPAERCAPVANYDEGIDDKKVSHEY